MTEIPNDKQLEEFIAAGKSAADHGLLQVTSGNLSWRIDDEHMLVTNNRSWLGKLTPDDISLVHIADNKPLDGKKPSVEASFHAGVLRNRPELNVVLHFQSPFATTISCRSDAADFNYFVISEIPYYIGEIATLPVLFPGSPELSDAVIEAMKDHDLIVLRNHGHVTAGSDFDATIEKAVFFELGCQIILQGGDKCVPLPQESVDTIMRWAREGLPGA